MSWHPLHNWKAQVPSPTWYQMPGVVPMPDRGTAWGLPGALSATDTLATRLPAALGAKATEMVQFRPAPRLPGHVVAGVKTKSAAFVPMSVIDVMTRAVFPTFVRVIFWEVLWVPVTCDPNVRLDGENDATGPLTTPR